MSSIDPTLKYPNLTGYGEIYAENYAQEHENVAAIYNEVTVTLLDNASNYARGILGQRRAAPQNAPAANYINVPLMMDALGAVFRNSPRISLFEDRSVNVNIGNRNQTTINHLSRPAQEGEVRQRAEEDRRRNDTIRTICGIVGIVIIGVGSYFWARANEEIETTRAAALEILDQNTFFDDVNDPNVARVRWVGMLHVRMLLREEEDAKLSRYKAIGAVATGALMGTGAIFGSVLAMQVSGVCALALGGKVIYDYFSAKNKRENQKDARSLLGLVERLSQERQQIINWNCGAQRPPAYTYHVGVDETNWKTAAPPSYEQAMSLSGLEDSGSSSSSRNSSVQPFPEPSAPLPPPPAYVE